MLTPNAARDGGANSECAAQDCIAKTETNLTNWACQALSGLN